MTFYSIDEDSLGLLFKQVKDRIVEMVSFLCGMHVDYERFGYLTDRSNRSNGSGGSGRTMGSGIDVFGGKHGIHRERIRHQETKMINNEVKKIDEIGEVSEEYARMMTGVGNLVMEDLFLECIQEMGLIGKVETGVDTEIEMEFGDN